MKKIGLIFVVSTLIFGCKTSLPIKPEVSKIEETDILYYFIAAGNEPFWDLKIGEKETVFKSLSSGSEKLIFPTTKPIKAADANMKLYTLKNSTAKLVVGINKLDCEDTMSGIVSPYRVVVNLITKPDKEEESVEGCGRYITDYRLHDIWVLEDFNGNKISISDFQKELPRIEINTSENKFMGFGGCNTINGNIFFEKDLLRFTKVVSTLMACAPNNKEDDFIKALQSTTTYSIENNRLRLSNSSGLFLIFRKVD